ncbi:MAG: transglutaminase domain-containing protein [Methanomicrobiales archaeon]|nr:transglutaminase domain-containing protein [Methanomicrobiales archaeon]
MHLPPLIPPASITPYLSCSGVITCTNAEIRTLARTITASGLDDIERTRILYLFVRDTIAHSVDAGQKTLFWNATDVLTAGHGLCFGKSHLLVALCRALGIPAGLCYQRVRRDDGTFVLHGLCAVYYEQLDKWVRLDPRGNKPGIQAEFTTDSEIIAYEPSHDGEWLDQHIYAEPWQDLAHIAEICSDVPQFITNSGEIRSPPVNQTRTLNIGTSRCYT